jgi:hypothetical protein
MTDPDALDRRADEVAEQMLARTLPAAQWTHEGHLLACISVVRRHGGAAALALLRAAIPRYNESTGVANTPTGGYHDTITVYFVWAIARLLAEGHGCAAILGHALARRDAPLGWWERRVLMSPEARAAWLPPTRAGDGSPGPASILAASP